MDLLLSLKTETIYAFAEQLAAGFLAVTKTDMAIFSKHPSRWATLFRVLSTSATHPTAATYSFELTCLIISEHPDSPVTADHFGECVDLLLSFSSGVVDTIKHGTSPAKKTPILSEPLNELQPPNLVKVSDSQRVSISLALERALQAIEKLYNMHLLIPRLIDSKGTQSQRGI